MLIILLAYLGGVLTIVSPCILPVLPFVFARADRSFVRSTLPLLAGMAVTFALVATLAAVGGGWAVRANEVGRWAALILLALFGIALVFPQVSDRLTRPVVALGSRLSERAQTGGARESIWASVVLGVATGLLWAPCAGPILGIIFTAAALQGASFSTTLLLLAYALGAATSLALALLVGGKVFARMKKSLGASERIRQVLGLLVLVGVGAIALGLDTRVLSKLSSAQTASLESGLARKLGAGTPVEDSRARTNAMGELVLPVEGDLPPLTGIGPWINGQPLTREGLRGKVVVIDFWTYSCINCLRSIPYVKAWDARYRKDGLVVIGVHAPEFAFERNFDNVRRAVAELGIRYPVALDNDYVLWRALHNNYWPAHYFVDARGRVRYHHSARAIMQCPSGSSASCSPRPVTRRRAPPWARPLAGGQRPPLRLPISTRPRPISAMRARTASSRPEAWRATSPRHIPAHRSHSMTGRSKAAGMTASRALAHLRPERRSASASMPATSTWCSARRAASRCAIGSRSTARRRVPMRGSTSPRTGRAL
jgi:cytochrome c biogenesis protein CcdA/thiol-disulfide isomerase/thioredoxin